ncbi:acyl-CoA thioesterase [Hyphobacterium sp. CCMP332]|nr:acyl-CoA thioesterase [Hyphobacterium sp. CCMP332]
MDVTKAKVRGYHLDLYGHVNNARYLEFLEEGRWSFYEKRVDRDQIHSRGLGLVVVNNNINYRYPARLHDVLEIHTDVERIGEKSITFKQKIFLDGTQTLVIDATVVFVILDMKSGKAIPIDDELKSYMKDP